MKFGDLGEQYVHLELRRNGFEHVYLANESTQKDWDIACFLPTETNGKFILKKLQVKTHNWAVETSHTIRINPNGVLIF